MGPGAGTWTVWGAPLLACVSLLGLVMQLSQRDPLSIWAMFLSGIAALTLLYVEWNHVWDMRIAFRTAVASTVVTLTALAAVVAFLVLFWVNAGGTN